MMTHEHKIIQIKTVLDEYQNYLLQRMWVRKKAEKVKNHFLVFLEDHGIFVYEEFEQQGSQ